MKKLIIALGLAATLLAAPTGAKAETYAYAPGILIVTTHTVPAYHHPQPRQNFDKHYRQEARWVNHHRAQYQRHHDDQCRNDYPPRVIWYR